MGEYTKVSATAYQQLQLNAGIILDGFTPGTGAIGNILGATTGGFTFSSNPQFVDFGADMDNVPANTYQLKRVVAYDPVASGTFLTITAALAKKLVAAGVVDSLDATHVIPTHTLSASDFEDVWIVGDYSDVNNTVATKSTAGYLAIHIMKSLNLSGFSVKTTKDNKGQFSVEYHGHYDLSSPDTVPFEIYVKAGSVITQGSNIT